MCPELPAPGNTNADFFDSTAASLLRRCRTSAARGSQGKAALCADCLALANMDDSIRALRPHRQVYIGPCQREQFTVGAHPGIYREDRCIPQICRSASQVLCLFFETQHAGAPLRLGQFVNGRRVLQPAPFNGKMQNRILGADFGKITEIQPRGDFTSQ